MRETTIKKIAANLRYLKDGAGQLSAILFLGAGASKSAGIPTAPDIMKDLENNPLYMDSIEGCEEKTYAAYMRQLNPGVRKKILKSYVEKATLNQTHLYAATLMKEKYIDTVVTVNFDPLMIRALAMVNIFPSVYDMAVSREVVLGGIDHPAVIFLHGQSHGFWQLNTEDEMQSALTNIHSLFVQITGTRSWIVVGYSGNDPVFDELAKIEKFEQGIYWIGYKKDLPEKKVQDQLLSKFTKSPWYLSGYNSDEFFRALKNELKVQEPFIINKPFSHLNEAVRQIGDFEIEERKEPWTKQIQIWIKAAVEGFEEGKGFEKIDAAKKKNIDIAKLTMQVNEISDQKNFAEILKVEDDVLQSQNAEALTALAYAYNGWGIKFFNEGKSTGDLQLLNEAVQKYKRANEIKPTYEAFYNWGLALYNVALITNYDEDVMKQAFEKYNQATIINPNKRDAFYNWGLALYDLAMAKNNDENLLQEAFEKYKRATEINPNYETYYNWGLALHNLAQAKGYDEILMQEAFEKYRQATELNPNKDDAFYNWGLALYDLAMAKNNDENLLKEAFEKYERATEIKVNDDSLFNWGLALHMLARSKNNDENLLKEAMEKYKRSTEVNPNYHSAFYNWGIALQDLATEKNNDPALLLESFDKLKESVHIKKDKYSAIDKMAQTLSLLSQSLQPVMIKDLSSELAVILEQAEDGNNGAQAFNLVRVYCINGNKEKALEWVEKTLKRTNVSREQIESDTDLKNIVNLPEFQQLLDEYRPKQK